MQSENLCLLIVVFCVSLMCPNYWTGHTHTIKLLIVYQKFKFNWGFYCLFAKSGYPISFLSLALNFKINK